jgi:MFS family permease
MSIAAVVGRLSAGFFLDRIFAPRIAAAWFAPPIIACAGLVVMPANTAWPYISAVFFGFALGAEYNLISYLSARYFGFKSYGSIYGALFAVFCVGQAVLPPLIGEIHRVEGSYRTGLIVLAGSFFISAGLLQFLGRYPDWGGDRQNQPPEKPHSKLRIASRVGDLNPNSWPNSDRPGGFGQWRPGKRQKG